jgi:hypothetical protein
LLIVLVQIANKWDLKKTNKQEIQVLQVARIWQAGRVASIDAGACGLATR